MAFILKQKTSYGKVHISLSESVYRAGKNPGQRRLYLGLLESPESNELLLNRKLKELPPEAIPLLKEKNIFFKGRLAPHPGRIPRKKAHSVITLHVSYTGKDGAARKFAEEMESSGIANEVRAEKGNMGYEYFLPVKAPETVLLIDSWCNQKALDDHHGSPTMKKIAALREKYDLHMHVERFTKMEDETDAKWIRK